MARSGPGRTAAGTARAPSREPVHPLRPASRAGRALAEPPHQRLPLPGEAGPLLQGVPQRGESAPPRAVASTGGARRRRRAAPDDGLPPACLGRSGGHAGTRGRRPSSIRTTGCAARRPGEVVARPASSAPAAPSVARGDGAQPVLAVNRSTRTIAGGRAAARAAGWPGSEGRRWSSRRWRSTRGAGRRRPDVRSPARAAEAPCATASRGSSPSGSTTPAAPATRPSPPPPRACRRAPGSARRSAGRALRWRRAQ
ncbi:hypothetical protein SVIOM342S_03062 [Streptomyces violaceorubidus]